MISQHQYKLEEEGQNSQELQKQTLQRREPKNACGKHERRSVATSDQTINENPNNITVVDTNGNDDNCNIKTEIVEPKNNNVQVEYQLDVRMYEYQLVSKLLIQ